jgi:hypothetical protein
MSSNNEDNSNIDNDEDKYYENYSMNVTYEEFDTCKSQITIVPNTRMRENEVTMTNQDSAGNNGIRVVGLTSIEGNTNNTGVGPNTTGPAHTSSLAEYSNFNFNVYNELYGNNIEVLSESAYMNRDFESNLDEIFDNLTYLISTEK